VRLSPGIVDFMHRRIIDRGLVDLARFGHVVVRRKVERDKLAQSRAALV
jgi:hypothetical protein